MATDSSSGTLPSSSRFTIDSSSSLARSQISFLTSTWVFSAMLLSRMRPVAGADLSVLVRAYCGGDSCPHQCREMCGNRLLQTLKIIAALENLYNSPVSACIGYIYLFARDPAEIFLPEIERGQRIPVM